MKPEMDAKKLDLKQRTMEFAAHVVRFYISLDQRREELRVLGKQLLRSGSSVGANYREASRARSPQEFIAKVELCAQEADETQYWLELLNRECGVSLDQTEPIHQEADELISIFVSMSKNTKANRNK
jgi:four helix bundle protein